MSSCICCIKTFLAYGLSTSIIKGKPVFSSGRACLPKNAFDYSCSNWVFDNFILAEELFAKTLQSLKTCVLVNNNLCGNIVLIIRINSNILSKFLQYLFLFQILIDNFTFKVFYWVFLYWYYIKRKQFFNTFTVPREKSKMVSFGFRATFSVKLVFLLVWISIKCLLFT